MTTWAIGSLGRAGEVGAQCAHWPLCDTRPILGTFVISRQGISKRTASAGAVIVGAGSDGYVTLAAPTATSSADEQTARQGTYTGERTQRRDPAADGSRRAGQFQTGTYICTVPENEREQVRVEISYSGKAPTVAFEGSCGNEFQPVAQSCFKLPTGRAIFISRRPGLQEIGFQLWSFRNLNAASPFPLGYRPGGVADWGVTPAIHSGEK
jgi:hypothetical protein